MLEISHIESFFSPELRPFKRNLLREYLHYKILEQIFRSPWAEKVAFMGGTAIHIVHGNTRFSEDLDFDNRGIKNDEFQAFGAFIVKALTRQGYSVDSKVVMKSGFHLHIRFIKILFDTGISRHGDEVLTIRVDLDPQHYSYTPEKIVLSKFDVFERIAVAPVNLLVAQKIACLFSRPRPMGRDAFDIVFLLGKSAPDMAYLHEKLGIINKEDLRKKILKRCKEIDFKQCAKDVGPFLFSAEDAKKVVQFYDWAKTAF